MPIVTWTTAPFGEHFLGATQMRTGGLEESLTLRKDHHASPESGTSTGDVAWPLHKHQCHGRKGWDLV